MEDVQRKTEHAQADDSLVLNKLKNTTKTDVQEDAQPGLEEIILKLEKNIRDEIESLVNSMKQEIMNKLDEIKTQLSLEITDVIKTLKELGVQTQTPNKTTSSLHQKSLEKDALEAVYFGAAKNTFYPVIVDYITSSINAFKSKIPQNILEQHPEFPAALLTTTGPISMLFESYSFLKDIPDIKPEENGKSQILIIIKELQYRASLVPVLRQSTPCLPFANLILPTNK